MDNIFVIEFNNDSNIFDLILYKDTKKCASENADKLLFRKTANDTKIICCKLLASTLEHNRGIENVFYSPEVWKRAKSVTEEKDLALYVSAPVVTGALTKLLSKEN